MSYTLEQLRSVIEDGNESPWSNSVAWYWFSSRVQNLEGIGTACKVDSYGGEGEGTDLWVVFRVDGSGGSERWFKKSGYHQSYEGSFFDGELIEVRPFEKTITDWEEV